MTLSLYSMSKEELITECVRREETIARLTRRGKAHKKQLREMQHVLRIHRLCEKLRAKKEVLT